MNKKGYSHILDVVAGDQVPKDLDLAPNIMNRIQKRKGVHMQTRTKLLSAVVLVAIVLTVLFYTVPGMASAIGRWFGYVPGIGLVGEGQVRALADPVSVTREGVTVTVDQVILNPERTALVYSVDGIPDTAMIKGLDETCSYMVSLRLPDGRPLLATPNGVQSWASGYQHRFNYPPVPAAINDATLVIDCLFHTRPGAAPEDWEIPLHFVPAPPDLTAFPVIEIPTPTAPAVTEPPAASASETAVVVLAEEASPEPVTITMTLDRAVQMDDGYLLYATLHWKDTPFYYVDMIDPVEVLHLLDGSGQEMLYEVRYDEQTGIQGDQRQTVFAIKTAPVLTPGPLTLVLDSVFVETPIEGVSFVFDPGLDPKPGQRWQPDLAVTIGEHRLRVFSVVAAEGSYSFEMASDTGIQSVGLNDFDHTILSGSCTVGDDSPESVFGCGFNYEKGLPSGPVTVSITSIGVMHNQPLQAQWTPPAVSPNLLPTQSTACLTAASWKTALAQKPALPAGITGKVLTSGLVDAKTGQWDATIFNLNGSDPQVFEGAQDGAVSPDGSKLVYSVFGAGISVADLAAGQTAPVPGTGNGDFNPIWSPDGTQIVFNRGMGIFDLFMVKPDGSEMRQLTHGGVQEWPVGWLPDGKFLYTVPGRENEYDIFQLDVQSGAIEEYTQDNLGSISPDGRYTIMTEKTFGDRWLTYISELDGSNRWLLNDSSLWVLSPTWSPDGKWLLAGVSDTDSGSTIGALIELSTCQVIPMPALTGTLLSWTP